MRNQVYPLKDNQTTFQAMCDRLKEPYSIAGQYFAQMSKDVDSYEITNYFYNFL